jgi:hypothetical protein
VNAVAGVCIDKDYVNKHVSTPDYKHRSNNTNSFSVKPYHPNHITSDISSYKLVAGVVWIRVVEARISLVVGRRTSLFV